MSPPISEHISLDKSDAFVDTEENVPNELIPTLGKAEERMLRLQVDLKVVTMMSIILAISIIDRINIGNAKVLGMDDDLGTNQGARYSVSLLLFFPGYFLAEVPSNMILVKFGVKSWMSFITFGFGLCVMCMGFAPNWKVLAFLRFMLGLFEGGIYPACVYLLSSWYPRYKLHRRLSALYGVGVISSAFGGVLAYGISRMSGTRNMLGWRWVFIIEGVASMIIGPVAYFFLTEFPDRAKFLKPHERRLILHELRDDSGSNVTEHLSWALFKRHCGDWFIWMSTMIFMCVVVPTYGFGFFVPSILVANSTTHGLEYSGVQATLHSAPPYAAALGMLLITAYIGDKFRMRGPLIIFLAALTLTGVLLLRPYYSSEVRYFGLFLAVMGAMSNQTAIISFSQNNIVGSSKRLLVSALNITGGALGGIIGSTIFKSRDAPLYAPGLHTVVGLQVAMIVMTASSMAVFWQRNRRADANNEIINGVAGWRHTL